MCVCVCVRARARDVWYKRSYALLVCILFVCEMWYIWKSNENIFQLRCLCGSAHRHRYNNFFIFTPWGNRTGIFYLVFTAFALIWHFLVIHFMLPVMFSIILTLVMDLLLLQCYCNDNCDVGSHKRTQRNTVCWQVITLYLLFILYKGLMMDWFQSETCNQAYEREYKLCFDWWFIFYRLLRYNTTRCVLLIFFYCNELQIYNLLPVEQ
jgi:hypothetical protein